MSAVLGATGKLSLFLSRQCPAETDETGRAQVPGAGSFRAKSQAIVEHELG